MKKTKLLSLTLLCSFFFLCSIYFNSSSACTNKVFAADWADRVEYSTCHLPNFNKNTNAEAVAHQIGKDIKSMLLCADYLLKTIVIDAGHGGRDHGCSGVGSREKDIVLKVALLLGQSINTYFPDIKVIYTRDSDVFIPLHQRADIANRNHADLFISIHCNSIPNAANIKGSETYVLGLHRAEDNLAVAKRENAAILLEDNYKSNYAGYDPNSAEGHIILSMFQNAFLAQSISFAEKVEKHIKLQASRRSRGVKQAGFLVLRETTMPSVLIETGYLTNSSDNEFLVTEYGQQQMAFSIFKAFVEYKSEVENSNLPELAVPAFVSEVDRMPALSIQVSSKDVTIPIAAVETEQPEIKHIPVNANINKPIPAPPAVEEKVDPVQFKVQLAMSVNLIETTSPYWKKVDHSIEILEDGKLYKYLAVGFDSYESASAAKTGLRQNGFKEAFVVAYQNGERITVEKARQQSKLNK